MCAEIAGAGDRSAFRAAEKSYQLHFEQKYKLRQVECLITARVSDSRLDFILPLTVFFSPHRNGRAKGAGLKAKDTDFSGVLDFKNPSSWAGRVQETGQGAYTLPECPGKPACKSLGTSAQFQTRGSLKLSR